MLPRYKRRIFVGLTQPRVSIEALLAIWEIIKDKDSPARDIVDALTELNRLFRRSDLVANFLDRLPDVIAAGSAVEQARLAGNLNGLHAMAIISAVQKTTDETVSPRDTAALLQRINDGHKIAAQNGYAIQQQVVQRPGAGRAGEATART